MMLNKRKHYILIGSVLCLISGFFCPAAETALNAMLEFKNSPVFYSFGDEGTFVKFFLSREDGACLHYRHGGPSTNLGIGIHFESQAPQLSGWERFGTDGNLILTVKAERPGNCRAILHADGRHYGITFPVTTEFTEVILPFRSFDCKGEALNPLLKPVTRLDIFPPRIEEGENRFYCRKLALSGDKVFPFSETVVKGRVSDSRGHPVPGAEILLEEECLDRYAWRRTARVLSDAGGNFTLPPPLTSEGKYVVRPLRPPPSTKKKTAGLACRINVAAPGMAASIREIDPAKTVEELHFTLKPVPVQSAVLTLHPDRELRAVNPLLYGGNMGIWHNDDLTRESVREAARNAGITFVRYPGGRISDETRWQRAEVPWDSVPPNAQEGEKYTMTPAQLDRLVSFCREIGAEPLITLNLFHGDVENAADMLHYLNVEKGYGVKYFEVGNEPADYFEAWGYGKNWDTDKEASRKTYGRCAELYLRYSAVLKKIDPGVKLLASMGPNRIYYDLAIPPFWEKAGEKVDCVTIHHYPQCDLKPNPHPDHLEDGALLKIPEEWGEIATRLERYRKQYSPRKRPLYAVTEWHTSYHSAGLRQQQLTGGLYIARTLCEMARSGIDMSTIFVITGCNEYNLFNISDSGEPELTPAYYCFQAVARNLRGNLTPASSNRKSLPVYAAREGDRLNVVCINLEPETAYSLNIAPPGWRPEKLTLTDRFNNGSDRPFDGTVVLPPYSVTVLSFTRGR